MSFGPQFPMAGDLRPNISPKGMPFMVPKRRTFAKKTTNGTLALGQTYHALCLKVCSMLSFISQSPRQLEQIEHPALCSTCPNGAVNQYPYLISPSASHRNKTAIPLSTPGTYWL